MSPFTWLPGKATRLNLDVVVSDLKTVLDRGKPNIQDATRLDETPPGLSLTQPGDGLRHRARSFNLSGEHELADRWTLGATAARYELDESLREHGFNAYITPATVDLYATTRETEARVNSASVYVTGRFDTGSVQHTLVAGIDTIRSTYLSDNFDANPNAGYSTGITIDLLNPEYRPRDFASYSYENIPYGGTQRNAGLYLRDQLTIGALQLMFGVRTERFRLNALGAPVDKQRSTVPQVGTVYSLSPERSVYATVVEGFQPVQADLQSEQFGGPFKPETSRLLEVGYKQLSHGGRLLFTASLYELVKRDVIVFANSPTNPDLYIQRGQERARGLELEASGRLSSQLRVIANYAYNDARIVEDPDPALVGAQKENAPRHAGTLWGRYDFGAGALQGFGIGAGVTHVGKRRTFDPALTLPAYTLLGAALYYERGSLSVQLQGKNLTDEVHYTGGYNFQRSFPGEPRSVSVSVRYGF